ncbi:hypothetical protein GCM10023205_52550 [Yinghuangia aomiensis]|uniref:Uncharacterized protein n=1 Tax=Yinghuangia aomiensis TaxID=676205 RepID=A0ABP9HUC1_9ACTN
MTHPDPIRPPEVRSLGAVMWDYAPRALPGLTTTTVLIAARWWNSEGAEGSWESAALMGAFAFGGFGVAALGDDRTTTTVGLSVAGAAATAGAAAYSEGLALPVLLWLLATVLVYAVAARRWRDERRETLAFDRDSTVRRETYAHTETVEAIRARAAVETAAAQAYAVQLADAYRQRAALDGVGLALDPTPILDRARHLRALPPADEPDMPHTDDAA